MSKRNKPGVSGRRVRATQKRVDAGVEPRINVGDASRWAMAFSNIASIVWNVYKLYLDSFR